MFIGAHIFWGERGSDAFILIPVNIRVSIYDFCLTHFESNRFDIMMVN
jgi:hypothetical protein